jgi:hypothetical protein
MQSFHHSKAVPVVPLSAVQSHSILMSPAERLDFEAAITRAYLSGLAYQRKLKQQAVAGMLQLAEVRS